MTQPREAQSNGLAHTHLPRGVVFVVAVTAVVMSLPGQTAGISAFTDFLIEALEITRAQLSIAYLVGTIASAFVLTPAGRAYDKLGSRVTGTVASAALGLSLVALTVAPPHCRRGGLGRNLAHRRRAHHNLDRLLSGAVLRARHDATRRAHHGYEMVRRQARPRERGAQ